LNAIISLKTFDVNNITKFIVLSSFIIIVFVDLKEMIIPDTLIVFNLVIIIIYYVLYNNAIFIYQPFNSFEIICAICFILMFLTTVIFVHIVYKKEIMGYGDIKLIFVMGLMIGITKLLYCIFISSLVALIIEMIKKRKKSVAFPFGPYLILGFIIINLL
jgi:prepilin signal peptidase PulO-like enzyme (type II secretory pathway)